MDFFDPKTFYFDLPIYTLIEITEDNEDKLIDLLSDTSNIDYYNPTLRENSTYNVSPIYNATLYPFVERGGMAFARLSCARTGEVYYFFYYYDFQKKTFMKIGQYPSVADFHIGQIKKYSKILKQEKLREFTKAIGLAANGVGIGSFVYLRRIFEGLIEEAHQRAKTHDDWDESTFSGSRMSEKIEFLKDELPEFLVANKQLYGILSVGIHALEEQECLGYFDAVRIGIELILDEKLQAFEREKKVEEARQKLASITSAIGKKESTDNRRDRP